MGRATETLWVQPRLRGFGITRDPRNPPSSYGRVIPYEVGWKAFREGMGDVPRGRVGAGEAGAELLTGVRLRMATDGQRRLARRAMERDLRRRIREGLVYHEIRQPRRSMRWVPLAAAAACIAGVGVGAWFNVNVLPYLAPAIMTAPVALMLTMLSRTGTRRVSVEGPALVAEMADGSRAVHPLSDIERVSGSAPFVIRVAPETDIALQSDGTASRRLLQALAPPVRRADANRAFREIVARIRLIAYAGFVIIVIAVTYMRWSLGIANGVQIAGWPLVSAAVNALIGVLAFTAVFELVFREGQILRWLQAKGFRRERRKQRLAGV